MMIAIMAVYLTLLFAIVQLGIVRPQHDGPTRGSDKRSGKHQQSGTVSQHSNDREQHSAQQRSSV